MRDAYRRLAAYRSEPPPAELNLADNTNLFGSAPSALAALAGGAALSAYPPLSLTALREALADWLGVGPEHVICGAGSNAIIDATMRALVDPGGSVAHPSPTFVMAAHFAAANSLRPRPVPLGPGAAVDVAGLLAEPAALTYVATPNNPSGTAAERAAIERLLDRASGVVLLDEAYAEFAAGSWIQEAVRRPNVIVTRTFSKAWGLAGLRLGYGVAAPDLVAEIEKARGPYAVSAPAERAARAALRHDRAWLAETVDRVRIGRDRFRERLVALGYAPLPSAANFVGLPVPDAGAAAARLLQQGIAVRAFAGLPALGDLLRITVGPPEAMERALAALERLDR